ncbi:ATPase, T2SS/T4P/T4SS family [Gammaproteobacteria bacterium]|nr:ATPase, T2SS/T4P/T4SS family [Gammaproteobacteria bacterium]MDA7800618.1 ATPase, T2SS/T4P/T4SS family [Gammaproteobacteria bacterium]MDA7821676.1 ATPase, T2SS/T4P/T4SS family [Gammaproteobacteria bacterium]MDA8674800.1 ATPase, T2SS/T4P/T4SS family [Gammaproteobacteria bacterium]MDA9000462.1 ATPase, T2SS/T4P/T4SS family [Gammaproteobacteria bacterium]
MENFKDQEDLSNILPYDFVKENDVLAFSDGDSFSVISPNNLSDDIYHEIQRFLKSNFSFSLCKSDYFNDLLTSSFSINKDSTSLSEELTDEFDLQSFAGSISATEDLLSGSNDTPIIKLINGIISQAVKNRASDIHFEPYENTLIVRFRVDGILKEILKQDSKISSVLISRIKIISGLDISERRLPQDGRVSLSLGDKDIDVRVSTLPSSYGERIVLRLLDKQASQINIDDLGLPSVILKNYKSSLKNSEGIILFTGPTGSGKTTTLYSGLRHLSDSSQNILTVEDPIEYTLNGIGQTQVNTKTGYTFAKGLRAILRQDPDVVMVGEMRDVETAQIGIQASLTGHLVLSTVHTNSAVAAITRLRDMGIESFLLASSLRTVISQRLVRRLCLICKKEESPSKDSIKLFNLNTNKKVFISSGCDACSNTGYQGRIAIAECIQVDKTLKEMIHNNASENLISEHVFKNNQSIDEASSELISKGITSCEELIRINNLQENASL